MVVGGSGYLGSYIGRTLASRGATVYSLSRYSIKEIQTRTKKSSFIER